MRRVKRVKRARRGKKQMWKGYEERREREPQM